MSNKPSTPLASEDLFCSALSGASNKRVAIKPSGITAPEDKAILAEFQNETANELARHRERINIEAQDRAILAEFQNDMAKEIARHRARISSFLPELERSLTIPQITIANPIHPDLLPAVKIGDRFRDPNHCSIAKVLEVGYSFESKRLFAVCTDGNIHEPHIEIISTDDLLDAAKWVRVEWSEGTIND